jgi:hypothetical protein
MYSRLHSAGKTPVMTGRRKEISPVGDSDMDDFVGSGGKAYLLTREKIR